MLFVVHTARHVLSSKVSNTPTKGTLSAASPVAGALGYLFNYDI
jgi:hypothetical protein